MCLLPLTENPKDPSAAITLNRVQSLLLGHILVVQPERDSESHGLGQDDVRGVILARRAEVDVVAARGGLVVF